MEINHLSATNVTNVLWRTVLSLDIRGYKLGERISIQAVGYNIFR